MTAGVTMREQSRKAGLPFDFDGTSKTKDVVTERLYTCPNGWSLGARRGGRTHLAGECPAHPDGEGTWEVFVLDPRGIVSGEPVGWVREDQLPGMVDRLANWGGQRCEANVRVGGLR